jgi:hypothetical protein
MLVHSSAPVTNITDPVRVLLISTRQLLISYQGWRHSHPASSQLLGYTGRFYRGKMAVAPLDQPSFSG